MIIYEDDLTIRYYPLSHVDHSTIYAPDGVYSQMYHQITELLHKPLFGSSSTHFINRTLKGKLSAFEASLIDVDRIIVPSKHPIGPSSESYQVEIASPASRRCGRSHYVTNSTFLESIGRDLKVSTLSGLKEKLHDTERKDKPKIILCGIESGEKFEVFSTGKTQRRIGGYHIDETEKFHLLGIKGDIPETLKDLVKYSMNKDQIF